MPADQFETTEAEYFRLKGQLAAGRISQQQFDAALKQLMFQDVQGRHWMIGADSGRWYVHDGKQWVEANPQPTASNVAAPFAYAPVQATSRGKSKLPAIGAGILLALCLCGGVIVAVLALGIVRINPGTPRTASPPGAFFALPSPIAAATLPLLATPEPPATPTGQITATLTVTSTGQITATLTVTSTGQITATLTETQTPTPTVVPGLYVTNLRLEPATPKRRDDVGFYPLFLNATSAEQKYRWLIKIYRPDNFKHSFGETPKFVPVIPVGAGEQKALGTWKLTGGGECESFIARVEWVSEDNQLTPFYKPDGQVFEYPFTVC